MNFDTCIIVCKRAIKHGYSYDGLLSREVREEAQDKEMPRKHT